MGVAKRNAIEQGINSRRNRDDKDDVVVLEKFMANGNGTGVSMVAPWRKWKVCIPYTIAYLRSPLHRQRSNIYGFKDATLHLPVDVLQLHKRMHYETLVCSHVDICHRVKSCDSAMFTTLSLSSIVRRHQDAV